MLRPLRQGGDSAGMGPAAGVWVTLHRVGRDTAGPMDSLRTDARGTYRFGYTPTGAADAVYFASTTWGGIAYFTAPLRTQKVLGDEAEITIFDTTSTVFPLSMKGRHLIVGKADTTDTRTVIEVFELSNDSIVTLVAADSGGAPPTWSIAIPASAIDVRAGEGEISPDAFAASNGRVSVYAPIAPGLKQISFSYRVPLSSFPLAVTAEVGAVVFEILLEESQGAVAGEGFAAVAPVNLEGRAFRRFLAQDVKPQAQLVVDLPSSGTPGENLYIAGLLVAIGFLMMLGLTRSMQRRANQRAASGSSGPSLRPREPDAPLHERLAQEIAALDATFAKQELPSASVQQAYETRRTELKAALADALASVQTAR